VNKTRLVLPVLAATAALAIAGCGGGGSSSDLAGFAAPGSLVFVEGTLQPEGELKSDVDALAEKVAGVDGLGGLIVSKLEEEARDKGEPLDFAKEVEPWLGERGAISFSKLNGDGDLSGYGILLETTDPEATQATIDHQAKVNPDPVKEGSYQGVAYWTDTGDETVVGLIGDTFVGAEDAKSFQAAVDASQGESLGDESQFQDAISAASDGSLADAYVDIGGIVDASGDSIDPTAREALKNAGVDPGEATAVASVLPGSDQVEIDVSADAGGETPPSGDASKILGSLPGDSFAAFASAEFGERLGKALDELDASGIPGRLEPHQLKQGIGQLGFDLDKVAGSLEEAGLFASGTGKGNLGGAAVFTTTDASEVSTAIKTIGLLVRQSGSPGVTALSGKANGFSIRSAELGPKPLVVATKGDRLAIGYGLPQTLQVLAEEGGPTLSESPDYQAAVSSLGDTPISGYVDGPGALRLARALVPASKTGFWEAVPYLKAIRYVAIGSGSDGDLATARLIVGVGE
jgi:Protein of unknown function (DUF3352)